VGGVGGAGVLTAAAGAAGGAGVSPAIDSAGGIGGLLATRDLSGASATSYIYFHDPNGNVSQLIDRPAGTLAAAYVYDVYGNTVYQTGPQAAENPMRFSTKYYDAELDDATTSDVSEGLYYYGYRYYSPRLGRCLSRDPIGERGGPNTYLVVANTPTTRIDPYGLCDSPNCQSCSAPRDWSNDRTPTGTTILGLTMTKCGSSSTISAREWALIRSFSQMH